MSCNCGGTCLGSKIAWWLVAVGGLNWGLVGVGSFVGTNLNIVNILLGAWPMVEALIYVVVGIATVVSIFGCLCRTCKEGCAECKVEAPKM